MSESLDLEKIKATLLYKAQLDELSKSTEQRDADKKLAQGMSNVPVKKMIDAAQFIQNNLLPRVKKKQGDDSADYLFFKEVFDCLLWAVVLADRHDYLSGKLTRSKVELMILKENYGLLEAELQKYSTLEELFLSDGLNRYAQAIKLRADALLKQK